MAATPSPSPLFQAFDPATSDPLVGGKVFTYAAGTTTPKTTWSDAAEGSANTNPVILDANGQAPIFIDGEYKFIVKDALNNLLYTLDDIIGGTNVFNRDASGVTLLPFDDIVSTDVQSGMEELAGKRVKTSAVIAINRGGTGQITAAASTDALDQTASVDIASATTTDIGAATSQKVRITGSVTITGLGTIAAGTERWVTLAAAPLLTHDATKLILPGGQSIQGAAGDRFHAISLGSGNWLVFEYEFFDGSAIGDQGISTIASATTTAIAAAGTYNNVSITGTTTITGFGTVKAGVRRKGVFTGALTLTYDATSMILPGSANIDTAAGDTFEAVSLGSGNWRVLSYVPAAGVGAVLLGTLTTTSGTTQSQTWAGTYRFIYIEIEGVRIGSTAQLKIAVSRDGGANYSTAVGCSPVPGGSGANVSGVIVIEGAGVTPTFTKWMRPYIFEDLDNAEFTTLTLLVPLGTGPINGVRFSGNTFAAGTIRFYGVR